MVDKQNITMRRKTKNLLLIGAGVGLAILAIVFGMQYKNKRSADPHQSIVGTEGFSGGSPAATIAPVIIALFVLVIFFMVATTMS